MASTSSDSRLTPSILDRLIDLEPSRQRESVLGRTQVLRQMKISVGRDLQNLLNTRCRATSWPEGLDQLDVSLFNYGIPDCVGINTGSREQQQNLRRLIQRAVEIFEPRLKNVNVSVSDVDDPTDRALRFRIDAMLDVDPAPEPVVYDSDLDVSIGSFSVGGASR